MPHRRGFTFVEVTIVICIIGVLVALLLPAVQAAREAARRRQCSAHLLQLGVAVQHYEHAFLSYPPGVINNRRPIRNAPRGYHHGWLVHILPFREEKNTWRHIDRSVGVYHKKNNRVAMRSLSAHYCPSSGGGGGDANYAAVHHDVESPIDVDNHGVFFLNSRVAKNDISDGLSLTLFMGEKTSDSTLGWMSGTRATLRNTGTPINSAALGKLVGPGVYMEDFEDAEEEGIDPFGLGDMADDGTGAASGAGAPRGRGNFAVGGYSSAHPGGAQFTFGDGRVSFLTNGIDNAVYQQLGHRADGKLLDGNNLPLGE